MYTILIIVQVLIAIGLVVLILLQHGKGADAGAAFGSGASSTVFGSQGSASFLTRITAVLATLFFLNSLALSTGFVMGEREPSSVAEQVSPVPAAGEAAPEDLPPMEQSQPQESAPADVPAMDMPAQGEQTADDLPQ
ncbi:protein-export membrane protein SecG [Thiohalobacter sp. COW1]|uniref:Protein-export membrane protein SecG n=2 Tax=Thiohalobacteraceae TaxID=3085110 RepID=A0A1Z4VSB6_9GAMM|nr:uncharacterized protein FOKN1_1706 [Thiohalobacter thiocyanaticus]BCO30851.1 protein-export membrane protein SecG [Thiohalobacter sp. COW1]